MTGDKKIDLLKIKYEKIEIPSELEFIVKKTINSDKRKNLFKRSIEISVASVALIFSMFIGVINISPGMAMALSEKPIIGSFVQVLTFKNYSIKENNFIAEIDTPQIIGLDNQNIQNLLNKKYIEENKLLYDQFINDMEKLKLSGEEDSHMGIFSGYQVKTDNDNILAIQRYAVNIVGSSSTVVKYDTIDKKNEILLTLPSLFKDDFYVEIISENIKEQMRTEMKNDENKIYWLDEEIEEWNFNKIKTDQNFYINGENKLVVVFDKYEVAPGSMGVLEFVIPTEIIQDNLISKAYIN